MLDKRTAKTLATKVKLFEAAQRIFANCGFERASIDQIARRASFSRGVSLESYARAAFATRNGRFCRLSSSCTLRGVPQRA
jgi:hypothetical protein